MQGLGKECPCRDWGRGLTCKGGGQHMRRRRKGQPYELLETSQSMSVGSVMLASDIPVAPMAARWDKVETCTADPFMLVR